MERRKILVLGPMDAFFYRCERCKRLMTRLEEMQAVQSGKVCPCGAKTYRPCNPSWYHVFLPRVWKMLAIRLLGGFDYSQSDFYQGTKEG